MCTFMNTLNRGGNSSAKSNKQRLFLAIRPTTDPNSYYRFRILNFTSPKKSNRTTSFIERFVHTAWGKNEAGKPIIESQVVCPATKYVVNLQKSDCPICKLADMNFASYKESGYRDKESLKKNREYMRKFEALVPVWVVNDPNYEKNNNKLKVIAFDKTHKIFDRNRGEYVSAYEYFQKLIDMKIESGENWCNAENAVDICMRMERVPKSANEGTPKEAHWEENEFKMITFAKKPYTISAITKELIDNFEFDDQYYVSSTLDELKNYYNKYCKVQMDDVDIPEYENVSVKPAGKVVEKVDSSDLQNDLDDDSEDDNIGKFEKLIEDGVEVEQSSPKKKVSAKKTVEKTVNEEIDELLDEQKVVEKKSSKKEEPKENVLDDDEFNLDDLDLDGI